MLRPLAAVLTGLVLVVAGCGDDTGDNTVALTQTTVVPTPTATTPEVTTATTVTVPPTTTTTTTGEEQGDEESIRVPAAFTITGGGTGVTPAVITVPAFFPVELTVKAEGGATKATFTGSEGPQRTMTLENGDEKFLRVGSLEPGDYILRTGSGATATVRSVRGGDVGP